MRKLLLLSLLTLVSFAAASEAAPIYADGNTCPTGPAPGNGNDRQYSVTEALRCVYRVGQRHQPGGDR